MKLRFSVVIPTCHRNDLLSLCLERLAPGTQTLSADRYEIIVTDDGTTLTAADLLRERFPWAKWTAGPRKGPAANRNHGAAQAEYEWLVFCDDDCVPDLNWLSAYAMQAENQTEKTVLEGMTMPSDTRTSAFQECPINDRGGHLWSCNFAIKRDLFRTLGGFDERFSFAAMEDVDFAYRLRKLNVQPEFVPGALVLHPWKPINFRQQRERHLRSELLYLQLHPEESQSIHWRYHTKRAVRFWLRDFFSLLRISPMETLAGIPAILGDQLRTIRTYMRRSSSMTAENRKEHH